MDRWMGKVAVVSGASSGIGASVVISLAKAGMTAIGLSRRRDRIESLNKHLEHGHIHAYECDITEPESVQSVFNKIEKKFGGVNVLVNNAGGFGMKSIMDDDLAHDIKYTMDVNFMGVIYCTKAAYNILNKSQELGHIVNIGSETTGCSIIDFDASSKPDMYGKSKEALRQASEGLQNELRLARNKNIKISQISPGFARTKLVASSECSNPEIFDNVPHLLPENIARTCLEIISKPERVQNHDVLKPVTDIDCAMSTYRPLWWQ